MADCENCGAFMYDGRLIERFDTCGASECERAARDAEQEERDERHAAIDREYEW